MAVDCQKQEKYKQQKYNAEDTTELSLLLLQAWGNKSCKQRASFANSVPSIALHTQSYGKWWENSNNKWVGLTDLPP